MQFKIVNTVTQKVIYDNLMSYEEAKKRIEYEYIKKSFTKIEEV